MHVPVLPRALNMRTWQRKFHNVQRFDIETLKLVRCGLEDLGDTFGGNAVGHAVKDLARAAENVDGQPERPGVLAAHLFDDLADGSGMIRVSHSIQSVAVAFK